MADPRVYFAGKDNSGVTAVLWVHPITRVITELPSIGVTGDLEAIEVIDTDDIWVGFNAAGQPSIEYPTLFHWDGASWTTYDVVGAGSIPASWMVFDIYAVSSSEIYAIALGGGGQSRILEWNGSAWSVFTNPTSTFGMIGATFWRGSTSTDMWICNVNAAGKRVAHWNGSIWDEIAQVGTLFVICSGMISYKGDLIVASRDGNAYRRTGFETFTAIPGFTVPNEFDPRDGNSLFHDEIEDILWAGAHTVIGVARPGVTKWDGNTATFHIQDVPGHPNQWWRNIDGFPHGGGQDAEVWFSNLSTAHVRTTTGVWERVTLNYGGVPGQFNTLQAFGSLDDTPPTIDTNSPTGTVSDPTPTISFSTKDSPGTGVNSSTIQCTVNGQNVVVNGIIQSGWSGTIVANAFDGFDVSITPDSKYDVFIDVTVSVDCDDTVGNSADTFEWTFEIEGIELVSAETTNEYTIRATFNIPMNRTNSSDIESATNPAVYTLVGGYRQLSVLSVEEVSSTVFDLTVLEMTLSAPYELIVASTVEDETGDIAMGDGL